MANENSRNMKRVVSGLMALSIVASQAVALPANVDAGGLFGSIVASATTYSSGTINVTSLQAGDIIDARNNSVTINNDSGKTLNAHHGDSIPVSSAGYSHYSAGDTVSVSGGYYKVIEAELTSSCFFLTYKDETAPATTFDDKLTVDNATYTGSAVKPVIKYDGTTLTEGQDYTYAVYKTATPSNTEEPIGDPTDVGTYYVKVTGKGNYSGEKIIPMSVSYPTLTANTVIKFDENGEYEFTLEGDTYIGIDIYRKGTYKFKLSSDGKSIDLYNADTNEKLGTVASDLPGIFAGTAYVSNAEDSYIITPNVIYNSEVDKTALHVGDILAPGTKITLSLASWQKKRRRI